MRVEAVMVKDLVAYHDGFTRTVYKAGEKYAFEPAFAQRWKAEGYLSPIEDREVKPAKPKREYKRSAKQSHNSTDD